MMTAASAARTCSEASTTRALMQERRLPATWWCLKVCVLKCVCVREREEVAGHLVFKCLSVCVCW